MKNIVLTTLSCFLCIQFTFAQRLPVPDPEVERQRMLDSISASYHYQTGDISLANGLATLTVPKGWRYLDAAQSGQLLTQLWGNPPSSSLGMLFPENLGPLDSAVFAFIITWEPIGYVKDDDAADINYEELLLEIQQGVQEKNKQRLAEGYPALTLVGWASKPFYNQSKKVLYWARELQVEGRQENTLNYDVRVLGRKGILSMNAVASMSQLPEVEATISDIISAVTYTPGNRYSDFSESSGDEIAAYTIGGLVAGKMLAKAGFFGLIAKFGKVIILFLVGGATTLWRRFMQGRSKEDEETDDSPDNEKA